MDIRLLVSKNGQIGLACHDGAFTKPIVAVELDALTTMLSLRLKDTEEAVELNCPVHEDCLNLMLDQHICTVGFYLKDRLAGAMFVPFHVVNMPYGSMMQ